MSRITKSAFAALIVAATGYGSAAIAKETNNTISKESDGRIEIGYLTCEFKEGSNIVVKADRKFDCVFNGVGDEFSERYTADATTIGLDLMVTEEKTMRWAVLAPSTFDQARRAGGQLRRCLRRCRLRLRPWRGRARRRPRRVDCACSP